MQLETQQMKTVREKTGKKTLMTDAHDPAAHHGDQRTSHRRSEDIYCKCMFWFSWMRRRVTLMWVFQVHDHEGVLACSAITEADLQTAGRRSRPGFIDDLHWRESLPAQLLLIDNVETSQRFSFRFTLDATSSSVMWHISVKQKTWMEFSRTFLQVWSESDEKLYEADVSPSPDVFSQEEKRVYVHVTYLVHKYKEDALFYCQ